MTTAKTQITVSGVDSSALDLGQVALRHALSAQTDWPDGSAVGSIEAIWSDRRTLAAAAGENLDLNALIQAYAAGGAVKSIVLDKVKAIYLEITSAVPGLLTIGGGSTGAGAADAWAGAGTPFAADGTLLQLQAGSGLFVWQNPVGGAVTAVTSHILRMEASGLEVTYDIVILGGV